MEIRAPLDDHANTMTSLNFFSGYLEPHTGNAVYLPLSKSSQGEFCWLALCIKLI